MTLGTSKSPLNFGSHPMSARLRQHSKTLLWATSLNNYWSHFHENFTRYGSLEKKVPIKLWKSSVVCRSPLSVAPLCALRVFLVAIVILLFLLFSFGDFVVLPFATVVVFTIYISAYFTGGGSGIAWNFLFSH